MVLDLPTTLHLPLPPQEAELPALAEKLHQRLVKQMALNVRRLDVVYAVMAAAAMASEWGGGRGGCFILQPQRCPMRAARQGSHG